MRDRRRAAAIALVVWTAGTAAVWTMTVLLAGTSEDFAEDHGERLAFLGESVLLGLVWLLGLALLPPGRARAA